MCAIFGFVNLRHRAPKKTLKRFFRNLAVACEARGTDATGISYVENGKLVIKKSAMAARKADLTFPCTCNTVMGHTRMATQGKKSDNFNNHPFPGSADKEFALAHNGVFYNETQLAKTYLLPDTHIKTDSYVAVQLIEHERKLNFDSLKFMAENVEGAFMITVLDEDENLYLVKGSNPICIVLFPNLGLLAYASTREIMDEALEKSSISEYEHKFYSLKDGQILKISPNGESVYGSFKIIEGKNDGYKSYKTYSYSNYTSKPISYYKYTKGFSSPDSDVEECVDIATDLGYPENMVYMLLCAGFTSVDLAYDILWDGKSVTAALTSAVNTFRTSYPFKSYLNGYMTYAPAPKKAGYELAASMFSEEELENIRTGAYLPSAVGSHA